jgi:hypothetical protein
VLCARDPPDSAHGSAGYRVTLNRLEICDLDTSSTAYQNGLREIHRVTHVGACICLLA